MHDINSESIIKFINLRFVEIAVKLRRRSCFDCALKKGLQLFPVWLESRCLLDKLAYSGHGKSSGERGSVMI
jgi:hypothetical protein